MCKKLCFLMSVVLVLGLVGSVPAADNPGRGAYIIIIASSADEELAAYEPFLAELYGDGVSIESVAEKYEILDDEKIANLESASLIIVSRKSSSGDYDEPNEPEFWNGLSTPLLLHNAFIARSQDAPSPKWSWFNTDSKTDCMELYMDVNDVCDPIFDGVTIDDSNRTVILWDTWSSEWGDGYDTVDTNGPGYGTLLATAPPGVPDRVVIARWAPGTQFWNDPCLPQTAGGPRIFFAMEGGFNEIPHLTDDGKKLLENAMTELLWYSFDPNVAYGPHPKLGATDVPRADLVLRWSPGNNVGAGGGENGHKIYFSSNWADVNDHSEAALVKDPNFRDSNEFEPAIYFEYGQTYYWCVDEYNDTHPDSPWLGHIWSFTMELSVTGEDWEDYPSTTQMMEYWSETSGTTLNLQHIDTGGTVHGGEQAMYMNAYQEVGEATRTFLPPTKWDATPSYKAMGVWFYGDEENVIADANLYLTIEDYYYHNSATVHYDGDMNDLADPNWHQWGIDLAVFRDAGVNLEGLGGENRGVKYLTLGFGNAGEDSTIYFDDIELFEWMCLDPPDFDVTGPVGIPDCVVDIWDFGALSDVWLEHEYDIYAETPTDPCVAHWDLEEGTGDIVADVTGNGNTGKFHVDCTTYGEGTYDGTNDPCWVDPSTDPCWVAAKMGTWALHFDGNDFIRVDDRWGAGEVDCANEPFTICLWMNYDVNNPGSMYLIFKGSDKVEDWLDPVTSDEIGSEHRYSLEFSPPDPDVEDSESSLQMYLDDDNQKCSVTADELEMAPGVWYHVAMQRDWNAAKMRVYVNAELVGEDIDDSQASTISSPNEPLFIGMKNSRRDPEHIGYQGNRFVGKLDDIYLYKSALSEEEILSVMGWSYRVVLLRHPEFDHAEDGILNFGDLGIIAEDWGVNTRFPEFSE